MTMTDSNTKVVEILSLILEEQKGLRMEMKELQNHIQEMAGDIQEMRDDMKQMLVAQMKTNAILTQHNSNFLNISDILNQNVPHYNDIVEIENVSPSGEGGQRVVIKKTNMV
jgi:uncharacterized coiled-coil DUF342 family protein